MFPTQLTSQLLHLFQTEKPLFTRQGVKGSLPLSSYTAKLHSLLSVEDFVFEMTPDDEQLLHVALLASDWMLSRLTVRYTRETSGYAYQLGDSTLHTGRTREGRYQKVVKTRGTKFELIDTDTYFTLPYEEMTILANVNGMGEQLSAVITELLHKLIALDMLRVGFNGRMVAIDTDVATYPNGEDVNIGWHQIAKNESDGAQILTDAITLGQGGDFTHIDALANHLIDTKLPKHLRDDPSLVVMVGSDLAAQHRLNLFNPYYTPAELSGAQMLTDRVAGRFAFTPPFMPSKRLTVTTLQNLHIYTQKNTPNLSGGFSDENKRYQTGYLRSEGYALGDVAMYAAADEDAITLLS